MTTVIDRTAPVPTSDKARPTQLLAECATCPGHCCRGDMIFLHPELGDVVAFYQTEPVRNPVTQKVGHMLAHKPNGDCVYLSHENGAGRCGVYAARPAICRAFDCAKSYAKLPRAERRRMVRDGLLSVETLEQGRRVLAARGGA